MDSSNITIQGKPNPIEVKAHAEVSVQTMEIQNDDSVTNSTIMVPEGNQETTINMIMEIPTKRTMYRHPNPKRRLSNKYMY